MNQNLHEEIVWCEDVTLMNSPAFYDCIIHLICLSGRVRFLYNGRPVEVEKNDIAVISRPRLVTSIEPGEDFACQFLAAPDKFLHTLLPANNYSIHGGVSLFDNPVMKVSEDDAEKFRRDIENIRLRLPDVSHCFYREMVGSLLLTMIYDLFDFHMKLNDGLLTTDRVGYVVSRFFALLESNRPRTEREVSYYAKLLHVSPKYLANSVRRVSGKSVSSHINRAATAIILEYLKDDKLSISQIADEMNFSSISYFCRYCVKHIGMPPSEFRNQRKKPVISNP